MSKKQLCQCPAFKKPGNVSPDEDCPTGAFATRALDNPRDENNNDGKKRYFFIPTLISNTECVPLNDIKKKEKREKEKSKKKNKDEKNKKKKK